MSRQIERIGPLADLACRWRAEAADLRARYADERMARLCEVHADELERAAAEQGREVLSLSEAAKWSGFSEGHIRALIAFGDLRNVGRRYRPRVLRGDLPRKPGHQPPAPNDPEAPNDPSGPIGAPAPLRGDTSAEAPASAPAPVLLVSAPRPTSLPRAQRDGRAPGCKALSPKELAASLGPPRRR